MKNDKNLGQIFDKIQRYLHSTGQQQTVNIFNNNTAYLKLAKSNNEIQEKKTTVLQSTDEQNVNIKQHQNNNGISDNVDSANKDEIDDDIKRDDSLSLEHQTRTLGIEIKNLLKQNEDKNEIKNKLIEIGYDKVQIEAWFILFHVNDETENKMNDEEHIDKTDYNDDVDVVYMDDTLK